MKRNIFFLFLVILIPASFVQAQVSLQNDSVIKEMICHKWVMNKVMVKDGRMIPTPTKVKLFMTFNKNGDLLVSLNGGLEQQKWVYDTDQKLLKIIDAKDQSPSGSFKIIKLDEKSMVLFLVEDKDTMYFNRVD